MEVNNTLVLTMDDTNKTNTPITDKNQTNIKNNQKQHSLLHAKAIYIKNFIILIVWK